MRERQNQGQALIFLLVMLPLLMVATGVVIRSGNTLVVHNGVQGYCDRKALDAAAAMAQGLELLGKINPYAKGVIDLRRQVDKLLAAGTVTPALLPSLLRARQILKGAQAQIDFQQKAITQSHVSQSLMIINAIEPREYRGKIQTDFSPRKPQLHVTALAGYEGETGAPLTLTPSFEKQQAVQGKIKMKTEEFLSPWPGFARASFINVDCRAVVKMEELEAPWEVDLANPKVKLSLKQW